MVRFFRQCWGLCTLETPPQDIAYSRTLQLSSIALYFTLGVVISSIYQSWGIAAVVSALDTGLLVGMAYAALWVRNMPLRATQTTTALTASGVVLGLIALPLYITLHNASGILQNVDAIVGLGLTVWQVVVVAHILRYALEVPYIAGLGISLVYAVVTFKIANILIPTPVG